ncbi:hypothetical protein [Aquamicrobium sp.]|uniref:hypothetical protein n=1 Tax=Aquamicrobium sp. TaxID=1872579 RepID=UPI002584E526|nr:hypothetical protein [Aquamicrobium sp.]MCK9552911.1 hypothetical protein [Aquamicrobium sp.]
MSGTAARRLKRGKQPNLPHVEIVERSLEPPACAKRDGSLNLPAVLVQLSLEVEDKLGAAGALDPFAWFDRETAILQQSRSETVASCQRLAEVTLQFERQGAGEHPRGGLAICFDEH